MRILSLWLAGALMVSAPVAFAAGKKDSKPAAAKAEDKSAKAKDTPAKDAEPKQALLAGKSFDVEVYSYKDKTTVKDKLAFPNDQSLTLGLLKEKFKVESAPVKVRVLGGPYVQVEDINGDKTMAGGNFRVNTKDKTIEGSFSIDNPEGGMVLAYKLTGKMVE